MTAPKLRLAGFKEPWNSGVVSRLLVERKELAPQSKQYPLMAFVAYKGVASKGDRYDRSSLVKDVAGKLYKRTEKGDFIYSSNNLETGSIGLNKYGKACISPVYGIFCPTCDSDSEYIGVALCRKKFIQEMVKWRQGVVYGQWRIHEDDFLGIPVPFPDGDEQRAMGCYFASLDRLIDAEVLRLESLRKLKVACLEKMFVHDGEKCPRLRLKGFRGEWERFRFGAIVERRSESSMQWDLPRVEYADICSGEGRLVDGYTGLCNRKKGIRFQQGDVLFGKLRPYLRNNLFVSFAGIAVGDFWVLHSPNEILDGEFLFRLVETESFQKIANTSVGSKMPRADWNYVSDSIVSVPQNLEEQVAIAKFFADLDKLIDLAAFEQERMRHLKSACMERMFV